MRGRAGRSEGQPGRPRLARRRCAHAERVQPGPVTIRSEEPLGTLVPAFATDHGETIAHGAGGDGEPPYEFPKSPLLVLAVAVCGLVAVLVVHVIVSPGTDSTLARGAGLQQGQGDGAPAAAPQQRDGETGSGPAPGSLPPRDLPAGETPAGRSGGAGAPDPTESQRDQDPLMDPDNVQAIIASGFHKDFAPLVDRAEAECMAAQVVRQLGVDRLWDITEAMTEASTRPGSVDRDDRRLMTDEETERLNAHMRPCVDEEAAARLNFD